MARSTKGPKSDPAVTLRRNQVRSLVHVGFSNAMIAEVLNITEQTVSNDKRLWGLTSSENCFAERLLLWQYWKREGNLGADLEERFRDELNAKARIVNVLTVKVIADMMSPHVSVVENLMRSAAERGGPYEWVFDEIPGTFLPSFEELLVSALAAPFASAPTKSEVVARFVTHISLKASKALESHVPEWVETPGTIRVAMDQARVESAQIDELWREWLECVEALRRLKRHRANRGAFSRTQRLEHSLRIALRKELGSTDPRIAAFSMWRRYGPDKMVAELAELRAECDSVREQLL